MAHKPRSIWIEGKLPGFNEIIKAAKSGRGKANAYSRMKRDWTDAITYQIKALNLKPRKNVFLDIEWNEKDRLRDPDNIAAAKKFIIDALVKAGVIKNDGWNQIRGWRDIFRSGDNKQGVLVILK